MMTPTEANDRLHSMSIACLTLAHQNPRAPQAERTTTVVVDKRMVGLYPRISLIAGAAYDAAAERALLLRSTATAEKSVYDNQLTARVVFVAYWEGHTVNLSRAGALQLLTDGDLPDDVIARIKADDVARAEQVARDRDDDAFWGSLNRKAANTAPDGGRPPLTPRRRSTTHLLPALPHAEAVERMKELYR